MKKALKASRAALCVAALLATVGCDSIRDYSVRTYQGVMPINDFRPTGAVTARADIPNPSVPTPPPEAAPAASAPATATKPADASK